MRAVDTNLLVRLLARDDQNQVAAAERFVSQGAWVSQLVLAETVWVLDSVYRRSARQIAGAVEMMLTHAQLTIQDADVVAAALDSFRKHPTLGFSDCLVLQIARKAGHTPLGSFDRRLARLEGVQRV